MQARTNASGIATFYNYVSGMYGTVVTEYEHQHQCQNFMSSGELVINSDVEHLNDRELVIVLNWKGEADLDLLVEFNFTEKDFCLVGSKASRRCGLVE